MIIRRIAFALSAAALASPATAQPRGPVMTWNVDWGDQFCSLMRMSSDASVPIVGIRTVPGTRSSTIRILRPRNGGLPEGTNRIVLMPSEHSFEVSGELENLRNGQRVLDLSRLPEVFWEALAGANELQMRRGDRVLGRFTLTNSAAAVRALRRCVSDAMREWGIDEAAFARIERLPRSGNQYGLDSVDFPPAALARNAYGRMLIRLTVSLEGRATECRVVATSGDELLDRAGCPSILRFGSFTPAIDVDGRNISATYIAAVLWRPR